MTYVRATDGTRIHYRVTGRPGAPPVLFIQGLGVDKQGWNLQRVATAPWYQAVAVDNQLGRPVNGGCNYGKLCCLSFQNHVRKTFPPRGQHHHI